MDAHEHPSHRTATVPYDRSCRPSVTERLSHHGNLTEIPLSTFGRRRPAPCFNRQERRPPFPSSAPGPRSGIQPARRTMRMRSCSATKASSVPASSRARIRSRARSRAPSSEITSTTVNHRVATRGRAGRALSAYASPCMTASVGTKRPRGAESGIGEERVQLVGVRVTPARSSQPRRAPARAYHHPRRIWS